MLGNNMFAYCGNNPVMYGDPTGEYYALDADINAIYAEGYGGSKFPLATAVRYLLQDLKNYDPNNSNPEVVYNAKYFSAYNGTLVVRHNSDFLTSWALGNTIFLNHSNDDRVDRVRTLKHEYGHILQEQQYGTLTYLCEIFIPSSIYNLASRHFDFLSDNYYNAPWEYNADKRAQVDRDHAWWAPLLEYLYFRK